MTTQYDKSSRTRCTFNKTCRQDRPGGAFSKLLTQALRLTKRTASAAFIAGALLAAPATAQQSVLGRGDAVVTGFSGIKPADVPITAGSNPLDEFFIDLDGVSAQILSIATFGQPPQGQLVAPPSKLQIKARQSGQVFAIALDDGSASLVPNIYLGATSAYGLNLVLPDSDGDGVPERVKKGHPNAQWMPGQFGLDAGGGPGAIWRVDGQTGAITLFATLPGNSGAGVGDVAFDRSSRQFFASDLDSGLIYRLSETGGVLDSFDHGVSGRPQKGLAAVNDDGSRIDIKNPAFDTLDPGTWGFAADERRVQGMAVENGRLYYAVAGQIWSIGIAQTGFGGDARWEFDADNLPGEGPVTDMLFDRQGRIYLAQRGAQRASYDYSVFADAQKSNVVRFRREEPDNPATESVWVEDPEAYSIGMPAEHNHAEGGLALGYGHDASGTLRYGACGEMLWSTGHRLRSSTDDAETAEADVHGLQGNDVSLTRPQNTPPQQSYFADYDSLFGDAAKSGHVGDVEIWQPCDSTGFAAPFFGQLPPGILPPGDVPPELPPEFTPEYPFEANLRLTKRATPKTCSPFFGGWLCQYTVRVTNTGPDSYFGPVMVRDWLPAAPAGAVMGFAPTPPWNCWSAGASDYRCIRFGTFLAPGWSVDLTAYAWVPKAYGECHLTNAARIEWAPPGSKWNSNPFDDVDFASATIPADHCKPGDRSDLTIYKVGYNCYPFGGKLRCPFVVGVQNLGPAPYNGVIQVEDTVPAGTTAVFAGAPWVPAGPVGSTYTLTHPGANLAPGAFAPLFAVGVDVPLALAKKMKCRVENEVKITQAPGGSPQNFNPANDTANAVAAIPAKYCDDQPPRRSNLKIEKRTPEGDGIACEIGAGMDWCRAFEIRVTNTGPDTFNGTIQVTDIAPAGITATANGAGWTCAGLTCSTDAAAVLNKNPPSGDFVSFFVTMRGTAADARALDCKLTNKARIDSPLGAPKNINAADDQDQVSIDLPERYCQRPETNLKIEKVASPKLCEQDGNGWWCNYAIRVINTGPGDYNGPLEVEEALPAEPLDANWNAPWICEGIGGAGAVCKHPNTTIAANATKILALKVKFSNDVVKEKGCKLPNVAKIKRPAPGSPKNTNPGDDIAGDTALVPDDFCKQPPTDLELIKWGAQGLGCNAQNGQWRCPWIINVKNVGNADYNGKVVVKDWLPQAASEAGMQEQGGVWNCVGTAPSVTCTHPFTQIKPGQTVFLHMYVFIDPSRYDGCSLTNTAKILQAPGGSVRNTDAGNDEASSTLHFQPLLANGRAYCHTPVPSTPCPPGFAWNGQRCDRIGTPQPPQVCPRGWTPTPVKNKCCPPGEPWNLRLRQCGGDIPPPPPPPQVCEAGWTPIPGTSRCCPPGRPWTGQQCGRDMPPPQTCPPGTTGDYPKCVVIETPRCPNGWSGYPPVCCPPPSRFVGGQCVTRPDTDDTPDCRKGQYLSNGHCCPRGTVWNGQSCSRITGPQTDCPPGTAGKFPRCKPIVVDCPPGYVGKQPNCRKEPPRECPRGTVGQFPICKPIVKDCPRGMVGTPPNCRKVEPPKLCPPRMVGRVPNCRPVVRVCPPGMVGRPPNCKRINLNPQDGPAIRRRLDLPGPRSQSPKTGNAPRGFTMRPGGGGQSPLR